MIDTLTLALHGDIPLDLFALAVKRFDALVDGLTDEVAGSETITWTVSRLQSGSAIIEVRALSKDPDAIERAIRAYDAVGEALKRGEPIPFSPSVVRNAHALTSLLNGHITSISFSTQEATHVVKSNVTEEDVEEPSKWLIAWGSVTGDVGAISTRPALQFTLYDTLFDKAVVCHLSRNLDSLAREIWNKRVTVTGRVYRRIDDGRPIRVRDIVDVQSLESTNQDFRRARGAVPWRSSDELPEVTIRRLRDAH